MRSGPGLYAERQRELEAAQKEIASVKVSLQELTAGSEAANRALQDCRSKRDALLSKREFLRQSTKQLESLLAEGGFALLPGGTAEAAAQTQTALVKSLDSCAGRLESLRRSREQAGAADSNRSGGPCQSPGGSGPGQEYPFRRRYH